MFLLWWLPRATLSLVSALRACVALADAEASFALMQVQRCSCLGLVSIDLAAAKG